MHSFHEIMAGLPKKPDATGKGLKILIKKTADARALGSGGTACQVHEAEAPEKTIFVAVAIKREQPAHTEADQLRRA